MQPIDNQLLVEQFETRRPHLRAVALRMLGSPAEAEDAVQEAWLRLSHSDTSAVENMSGWLTTIVARICLDVLRARRSRHEESLEAHTPDGLASSADETDPEHQALLADSVGLALLVVLDTLAPAERLAFVLHDVFAVPFEEIAPIVERSPEAARKLASRARRRVRGVATVSDADLVRQRTVVDAFLQASREGNFEHLLQVLDPDVVLRADEVAVALGGSRDIRGATAVAKYFSGRARGAQPARINGAIGFVVYRAGQLLLAISLTVINGKIATFDAVAEPARLGNLEVVVFADKTGTS